jgi:hypothetical protein
MERQLSSNKYLLLAIILVIVLAVGFYGYNAFRASQSSHVGTTTITQSALEENYGLRVQLLAVTAAGGLVDLRFQIVDADKAQAFLDDPENIPALLVGEDVVLQTSLDAAQQDIQYENGKSIFVMYPNLGNVLNSGDPATIIFGDLQLETIQAK